MRRQTVYWRRAAVRVAKWLSYGAAAGCVGALLLGDATADAQGRGRERRGGGQGNAGVRVQGGGSVRLPTVQGNAGGAAVRVPSAGGEVRVPGGGAQVRLPEVRGSGATVRVPGADGQVRVEVAGRTVTALPPASIFGTVAAASAFFEPGSVGYSATASGHRLDGVVLKTHTWSVAPLAVNRVFSSYFADESKFPPGTIGYDCALIMRNVAHEWQAGAPMYV